MTKKAVFLKWIKNLFYVQCVALAGIIIGQIPFISSWFKWVTIMIAINICGLIGLYQEFNGHAEILLTIDSKLSKKWHTLFNWNVFGSIVVVIISAPILVLVGIVTFADENIMGMFAAVLVAGFSIIIQAVYLIYLKRTHDVCEKYEYWVDEVMRRDEI